MYEGLVMVWKWRIFLDHKMNAWKWAFTKAMSLRHASIPYFCTNKMCFGLISQLNHVITFDEK